MNEEKLESIEWVANQMPGGLFIYRADESQEIIYVNDAVCRIFGCETKDEFKKLTGNTFKGMVHPKDYNNICLSIDDQIQKDPKAGLDYVVYRIIRKDGVVRWVDDYGHYTQLEGYGNVFYVFIGDITDTRRIDKERKKNHQLKKALAEAERANRVKTIFLSNMSHEIRTPITAILGMNEIIQQETKDYDILPYAENIDRAGNALLRILSDLLDFAKIEAGKLELLPTSYITKQMLEDVYNMIWIRVEEKGLDFKFEIDPKIPSMLIGDHLRIKQILTNLLTNAIKYTESGTVTLSMKLNKIKNNVAQIKVSVSDSGIGIKEEEMEHLFEAFTRLDTDRTNTIEGTGIGLPICRQLLRMMGSDIHVTSQYNVGSTFFFTLEQKIEDYEPIGTFTIGDTSTKERSNKRNKTSFIAPQGKILVIDDTAMNLQVITGLLKPTQLQIDTAESGEEGIIKLQENSYNVVFLDYRMPKMDGIETLNVIKNTMPNVAERTPIISLTASAISGDREKMLKAGFTDYLSKPVTFEKIKDLLEKYLPKEKIFPIHQQRNDPDALPEEICSLSWIDPKEGIEYCGDLSLYQAALQMYVKSINEKASLIERCARDHDLKLYTINTHSLKSMSLSIGMKNFSEKARELELAGKAEDYATIQQKTPELLRELRGLKNKIEWVIKKMDSTNHH